MFARAGSKVISQYMYEYTRHYTCGFTFFARTLASTCVGCVNIYLNRYVCGMCVCKGMYVYGLKSHASSHNILWGIEALVVVEHLSELMGIA